MGAEEVVPEIPVKEQIKMQKKIYVFIKFYLGNIVDFLIFF